LQKDCSYRLKMPQKLNAQVSDITGDAMKC
jgi:hypothetical protein